MPLTIQLLRPDDLLALTIEAQNLKLDTKDPKKPMLVVDNSATPAYLIVTFAPQSITEEAYFETGKVTTEPLFNQVPPGTPPLGTSDDALDPAGQTPARMAGHSRLVFQLPKHLTKVPYQLSALLDWTQLTLVVAPVALGKPLPPPITQPTTLQTALELPYRLVLSPGNGVGWVNALQPTTYAGYTELWHTRLARIIKKTVKGSVEQSFQEASPKHTIPLRAIWSPDFVDHEPLPTHALDDVPFLAPLSPRDRAQIVILTSGTTGYYIPEPGNQAGPWTPRPIQASRLFLSSLGGWLSSRGSWSPLPVYNVPIIRLPPLVQASSHRATSKAAKAGTSKTRVGKAAAASAVTAEAPIRLPFETVSLDLTEWSHFATQGRDHYVRVVYEGYLYPFGHAATLVKVTERKFVPAELVPPATGFNSSVTAVLRQHMYIVVREREKSYDPTAYTFQGREIPFTSEIRINTEVTPDIDKPPQTGEPGYFSDNSFWVNVNGANFQFHVTARDLAGARIDFLAPLIFVSVSETDVGVFPPGSPSDAASVQSNYIKAGAARLCDVRGKKIAFADPAAGDTILKTTGLLFDAQVLSAPPFVSAPFIPLLSGANVVVHSLEELLGVSTPITIQYYQPYLEHGMDAHAGVFAEVNPLPASAVRFTADKAGGFATPSFVLTALSARKGMVAGKADDAAAGNIDPAAFFGSVTIAPKLFGTIPLPNLIPVDAITKLAPAGQNAPEIRSQPLPNAHQPTQIVTKIKWQPQLTDYSADPVKIVFNSNGQNSKLVLAATIVRPLDGSSPQSKIQGTLSNFEITLLGVVGIAMAQIQFNSVNGAKADVTVKLAGGKKALKFIGPLQFIQTLADILPPGLFGGAGPAIDLTSTGLRVAYTLGLPPISLGVFSLEHIGITAGLDLPYLDGKPGFEFAFSSRSKPFLLTVECIGGGGFVHLVLNADGIQMVEGALEFGGEFAFDIGVASGGVHIMAGIYFQLAGSKSTLTGFVDIGGEVSVLGIVSISIDVYLALSYIHTSKGDKAQGVAKLSISISILFFSISVSVQVERSFGSSAGDPQIADLLSAADWEQYALAFAG